MKKRILLFLSLLLLAAAAFGGWLWMQFAPYRICAQLLSDFSQSSGWDAQMQLNAEFYDQPIALDAPVFFTREQSQSYLGLTYAGAELYYSQGTIHLPTGRGFRLWQSTDGSFSIPEDARILWAIAEIETSEEEGAIVYSLRPRLEQAKALIGLLPEVQENPLEQFRELFVRVTTQEGALTSLFIQAEGDAESGIPYAVELTLQFLPTQTHIIPEGVLHPDPENILTLDLRREAMPMILSILSLQQRSALDTGLQLNVNCGPIQLSDTMLLQSGTFEGTSISCLKQRLGTLYFSGSRICTESVALISQEGVAMNGNILYLLYPMLLTGDLQCTQEADDLQYTLDLSQESLEQIAFALVPEAKKLNVSLSDGSLEVTVCQNWLTEISIRCSGQVPILFTTLPVSIQAVLTPSQEASSFSPPPEVLMALLPNAA